MSEDTEQAGAMRPVGSSGATSIVPGGYFAKLLDVSVAENAPQPAPQPAPQGPPSG